MFDFLMELIRLPGGAALISLAALLVLFQLVILAIAIFAEGRAFSRRWSAALALAAPATLLLCTLAGVQLCRAEGLGGSAIADAASKAMILARAAYGSMALQMLCGIALAISGLLSAVACGLSLRAGADEAAAPRPSFAGLGLMLGLSALVFGAGLAWRGLGLTRVFEALAAVDPSMKMELLGRGLTELSGLTAPALLALGLILVGAVWRIRDSRPAGKTVLASGILTIFIGGLFYIGTHPHAADAGDGVQALLSRKGEAHRPYASTRLDLITVEAPLPLKPGPELALGQDEIILDGRPMLDRHEREAQELEPRLVEEMKRHARHMQAMRSGRPSLPILLLDRRSPKPWLERVLTAMLKAEAPVLQLAAKQHEKVESAVYGPLSVPRWTALEIHLGEGDQGLWPREEEDAQAWAERLAAAAKDGIVRIAMPAPPEETAP
ncbi:MAG: hypothetical protein JXR96_26875 [Deltaproteobacteria bacterium]|nr:hypothetical protein [Deltaproteobacteria bacterium]